MYATDIAKAVQAPIFHVNGDDPEATVRVTRLAFAFRQEFKKDVVVDMVCYRRYGHNESDEPAFTLPHMYEVIAQRRSVRKLYTELLVNRGDLTIEEAEKALEDFRLRLEAAFEETRASRAPTPRASDLTEARTATAGASIETGVARDQLTRIADALVTFPPGFQVHPKLLRIVGNRRKELDDDRVDWSLAEALAFGSLLIEGTPVRLAGQDTRRGTFSQRHAVLVDHVTEAEYTPLAHLGDTAAPFMVYDSVLSEFAALGFEYGYSVADSETLVCWEAQFGDFGNGAQTIIDQFIVAAEDKWGERNGLVMLLPHGFEGQGPEHSSARLERFLVLCAQDNMRVVYPTTAAQYFHVLRRQVHDPVRKPMIVMTPKRYLRMPVTYSPAVRARVGRVPARAPRPRCARPRVGHAGSCSAPASSGSSSSPAATRRTRPSRSCGSSSCTRGPKREIAAELARYEHAEVVWAQEEPGNMGARYFARRRIEELAGGRPVASSPAPPARAPPPAAPPSTTPNSKPSSKKQCPLPERTFYLPLAWRSFTSCGERLPPMPHSPLLHLFDRDPRDRPHRLALDVDHRLGEPGDDLLLLVVAEHTFDELHLDERHVVLLVLTVVVGPVVAEHERAPRRLHDPCERLHQRLARRGGQTAPVEFRVLGSVGIVDGDQPLPVGGEKPRRLLGILLAHRNAVVSADRLVAALWTDPPDAASATLQSYVSRLRRFVELEASTHRCGTERRATCSRSRKILSTPPASNVALPTGRRCSTPIRTRPSSTSRPGSVNGAAPRSRNSPTPSGSSPRRSASTSCAWWQPRRASTPSCASGTTSTSWVSSRRFSSIIRCASGSPLS